VQITRIVKFLIALFRPVPRKSNIRDIGIMAYVDAGKTTVTERMLYYSGLTHRMGSVDDGNTIMDTDPQESHGSH